MRKTAYWAIGVAAVAAVVIPFAGCGNKGTAEIPSTVASVNGKAISADQFVNYATLQAGSQAMSGLIEQQILQDWAAKEGVAPTEEQMNKLAEAFKRDGTYEDQVKNIGEENVKAQLKDMQAQINLAKKIETVSDSDIQSAFSNPEVQSRYNHGPRKRVALLLSTDKAKVEEAGKKLSAGGDPDDVAAQTTESGRANKLWAQDGQQGPLAIIAGAAKPLKVGEVSKTIELSQPGYPTQYGVLKVLQEQPKAETKLEAVKDEISGLIAMQKFSMPTMQEKFNEQKKNAKIEINIKRLAGVASAFKNPPPAFTGMPQPAPKPAPKSAKPVKPAKSTE